MKMPFLVVAATCLLAACNQPAQEPQAQQEEVKKEPENPGLKVAFIYGDTINAHYKFLLEAQKELEGDTKIAEERIGRKMQRAERRAQELNEEARYMTQTQMQEAQLEMQNLQIELQQFEEKLAIELRNREMELQSEYSAKIDTFLNKFNADGTYDMILNFGRGGNVLWIKDKYDVTQEVLDGLNAEYDKEIAEVEMEEPAK